MARQVYQMDCIPQGTSIAAGATTTGKWMDIGEAESNFSLILIDTAGSGSSLTVVYELGYAPNGKEGKINMETKENDLQEITPDDGGSIADFTTVNLSSDVRKHTAVTLAVAKWYRFKITNNDGSNSSTVSLKILFQK